MTDIGRSNILFKLDEPPIDDDEAARQVGTANEDLSSNDAPLFCGHAYRSDRRQRLVMLRPRIADSATPDRLLRPRYRHHSWQQPGLTQFYRVSLLQTMTEIASTPTTIHT
jgi:hypothetical protein